MRRLMAGMIAIALGGCFYVRGSLDRGKQGYTNYPATIADEHARRAHRRKMALIAAPLELLGGTAIAALAIYGGSASAPPDNESVLGGLSAAGKELAGRLLMASVGGSIAISGIGDAVLGATDGAFASPLIRDGALIDAAHIDSISPFRSLHLDLHSASVMSTRGVGCAFGFGLPRWISDTVRLRPTVNGEVRVGYAGHDQRGLLTGELELDRAFGREHAGLYPHGAIGAYAGGGWAWGGTGAAPVARGGLAATFGIQQHRLGVSQLIGVERLPSIELAVRIVLRAD
jgi:hypothetical protein